jgi:Holliday junction DNA helicase RuvB
MENNTQVSTGELVRARNWSDYVGQEQLKSRLLTHIGAAAKADRTLDHMLLVAPPGAGKTTLAALIADELCDPFYSIMMPMDLKEFTYFCADWRGGIVLLDEIHRASTAFQEAMLSALDDGELALTSGSKVSVRHITFIGATTEPQNIIKPLWDRFLVKPRWDDYSDEEMGGIVAGMARRAGVAMPDDVAQGLARATGGTPRIAGSLVVACRDLLETDQDASVDSILSLAGIDRDGLSERHIDYLKALKELGGVSGLKNLCTLMQYSAAVLEELERLLLHRGFVRLERSGRTITSAGMSKLPDITIPPSNADRRATGRARLAA